MQQLQEGAMPHTGEIRTITLEHVIKALDVAEKKLGAIDRTCHTLRSWAEAGRVTPGGQLLTVQAVNSGITKWLKQKGLVENVLNQKDTGLCSKEQVPECEAPTPMRKRLKRIDPEPQEQEVPKKRSKPTLEEARKARQLQQEQTKDMTNQRFTETLESIEGHMTEILRRSGQSALDKWREAPPDCDRRELYMRLVHASADSDVEVPEALCAELLPHQVEGLEWLASLYCNKLHGILADEMGLGKTIQTIALLLHVQERKNNNGPHLIVAPKSMVSNWQSEFQRFAPHYRVHALVGDQDDREAVVSAFEEDTHDGKSTVCLTNYEQVHRNNWLFTREWQLIAVDEGHRLKNPETQLHNAMTRLRCRMRLLLTGTPLQNSVNELWSLLHYLLPDLFDDMLDFKAWFARPFKGVAGLNEYEVQLYPEQEQQVIAKMHSLLAPFLLQRLKSEALGDTLPPKVEVTVRVPLSSWQQSAYKDLERKTVRCLREDSSLTSEQVNNTLMQMRKIALHPYLFQDEYPRDKNLFRASGKVEVLDRILSRLLRFGHKTLIFSQFTSMLDILGSFLAWRGINFVRLDGQVSLDQRRERMHRFKTDPNVAVFILSARAGGLGLNLQAADTVILFDIDWNPQNDRQAVARVHRVGQTKDVLVIRLMSNSPVERHMEQRCQEKLEMEKKIMGAGMFRKNVSVEQRRQALHTMLGISDGSEAAATPNNPELDMPAVTSPQELSAAIARSKEELASFKAMDAEMVKRRSNRLMSPSEVPAGFLIKESGSE